MDVEIKFVIGNMPLSIDIHKKHLTEIKDLYKALHAISLEQKANTFSMDAAKQSLNLAASAIGRAGNEGVSPADAFKEITAFSHSQGRSKRKRLLKKISAMFSRNILITNRLKMTLISEIGYECFSFQLFSVFGPCLRGRETIK